MRQVGRSYGKVKVKRAKPGLDEVPVGTSYIFCSPGAIGTARFINLLTGAIAILSQC